MRKWTKPGDATSTIQRRSESCLGSVFQVPAKIRLRTSRGSRVDESCWEQLCIASRSPHSIQGWIVRRRHIVITMSKCGRDSPGSNLVGAHVLPPPHTHTHAHTHHTYTPQKTFNGSSDGSPGSNPNTPDSNLVRVWWVEGGRGGVEYSSHWGALTVVRCRSLISDAALRLGHIKF